MSDSTLESSVQQRLPFADLLLGKYGPMAFGTVIVIVIWAYIARPMIDGFRDDARRVQENQEKLTTTLGGITNTLHDASRALERTAASLERGTQTLSHSIEEIKAIQRSTQ